MVAHSVRFMTQVCGQPVAVTAGIKFAAVDGRVMISVDLTGSSRDVQLMFDDAELLGADLRRVAAEARRQSEKAGSG